MIKLFAFDLDGTLYIGDKVLDRTVELINYLRNKYKIVFHTNNSTNSIKHIHDKLNRLKFNCKTDDIYTSLNMTSLYLKENNIDNVYVIGSNELYYNIQNKGITVKYGVNSENLVVGLDTNINYNKITIALQIIERGGKFIVCNKDYNFPTNDNILYPGCGAIVGAIIGATNKEPDYIVGKPSTYIIKNIAKDFNLSNKEVIIVGDSYISDVKMAKNFECAYIYTKNYDDWTKYIKENF